MTVQFNNVLAIWVFISKMVMKEVQSFSGVDIINIFQ